MPRTIQEIAVDIARQRDLLEIHRLNLHNLRVQEARRGGIDIPILLMNDLQHTTQQIQQLESQLAHLEVEATEVARLESKVERERQLIEAFLIQRTNAEGVTTDRPVALAICLIATIGSIKADVEAYLRRTGWDMPVIEVTSAGIQGAEDIARLVVGLQLKKQAIQEAGYTEIHLFIAGPIIAGVAVGGIFDNWKPIKLYHKASNTPAQTYEYWMPLIGT